LDLRRHQVRSQSLIKDLNFYSIRLGIISGIVIESCNKAQIIDDARVQSSGKPLKIFECLHDDLARRACLRFCFIKRLRIFYYSKSEEQRSEGWTRFIVKFTRNRS